MELSGKTVLIVDDEPDLRDLLALGFSDFGCKTIEANSGTEGFEVVKSQHVDVVLSDVRMPGGSGIDLLDSIQEWKAGQKTHPLVFFMTGYADINEAQAIEKGASGLFHKPFRIDNIIEFVSQQIKKI